MKIPGPEVSILVFMDLSLEVVAIDLAREKDLIVSILVFMDLSLEVAFAYRAIVSNRSFNPCFHGSLSGSLPIRSVNQRGRCFNPCFHGSLSGSGSTKRTGIVRCCCFNPCFHGSLSGRS